MLLQYICCERLTKIGRLDRKKEIMWCARKQSWKGEGRHSLAARTKHEINKHQQRVVIIEVPDKYQICNDYHSEYFWYIYECLDWL